ncbi:P-loop containing nucleoside triphosphate hydrolase protein, partial [Mycena amicta]
DEIQTIRSCPPPSKFFQGRKDILLQLERLFEPTEQKEQKVVLLHGLGGAGKTQIALKFIADSESGSRFTDVFKINASSVETIEAGYKQIAMAKKLADTAEAAQTWLKTHRAEWLLLFDNADKQDLDLATYLPACNHGNILITSRNPGLWVHTGSPERAIAVSDLSLDDAVLLLLKRAGVELLSNENKIHAVQIELHCFALAIVQAGAFISKSPPMRQDISKYIPVYQENKATLLGKKPEQSHSDYQWTVYTTWQISFDQLGPLAAQFLQLCSFIHFEGITEDIFRRAAEYIPGDEPLDPTLDTLQPALYFLSNFKNESKWNSLAFAEMMSDICDYSLMTFQNDAYSIHPLVHQWAKTIIG